MPKPPSCHPAPCHPDEVRTHLSRRVGRFALRAQSEQNGPFTEGNCYGTLRRQSQSQGVETITVERPPLDDEFPLDEDEVAATLRVMNEGPFGGVDLSGMNASDLLEAIVNRVRQPDPINVMRLFMKPNSKGRPVFATITGVPTSRGVDKFDITMNAEPIAGGKSAKTTIENVDRFTAFNYLVGEGWRSVHVGKRQDSFLYVDEASLDPLSVLDLDLTYQLKLNASSLSSRRSSMRSASVYRFIGQRSQFLVVTPANADREAQVRCYADLRIPDLPLDEADSLRAIAIKKEDIAVDELGPDPKYWERVGFADYDAVFATEMTGVRALNLSLDAAQPGAAQVL